MEGNGRATTAFMRQLKKMFEEVPDIVWDRGAIIIPDPAKLEVCDTSLRPSGRLLSLTLKIVLPENIAEILQNLQVFLIPETAQQRECLVPSPHILMISLYAQFGYHRSYNSHDRIDRGKSRGVCYHKVAGAPACADIEGLLSLRPLVRRKKRESPEHSGFEDEENLDQFRHAPVARRRRYPNVHEDDDMLTDAARCLLSMTDFGNFRHSLPSAAPNQHSEAASSRPTHRVEQWI